ncbi:methyltransferase [Candidatus Woesearchaeota archaeon]|nr:methyltransferase [Candidatus Woesearchaeota archaeon]
MVYDPQEDSFFLKTFVQRYAHGKVLDMGTGSGIQAVEAYRLPKVKKVWGADIDAKAIAYCRKHHKGITWVKSDLFSAFKGTLFDVIIFNPPYLPQEGTKRHIDLEGGKKGYEVIEKFLEKAGSHLADDGIILLLFSSLSRKHKVLELIDGNLFVKKLLGTKRMFFEELYVYLLKKDPLQKKLEKKNIKNIKYLAHGKRGVIYTAKYRSKKVAIKVKREQSRAEGTIAKEAKWLKEMNRHKIGPKYLFHTKDFLVYEFVEGQYLRDLVGKRKLGAVLKKLLDKAYKMDTLNVEKKEMTRPLKNAIVKGQNITLIDFERMRKTEDPHNVTQLCQFFMIHSKQLGLNKRKIMSLVKKYAADRSKQNYLAIRKEL